MYTPKLGETLKFVYIKYQPILVKSYRTFTKFMCHNCLCVTKCLTIFWSIHSSNREVKHDVHGKRQTAKMKLLPSVFSSLYSRIKIFVFAVNSKRHFSIFV